MIVLCKCVTNSKECGHLVVFVSVIWHLVSWEPLKDVTDVNNLYACLLVCLMELTTYFIKIECQLALYNSSPKRDSEGLLPDSSVKMEKKNWE